MIQPPVTKTVESSNHHGMGTNTNCLRLTGRQHNMEVC